MRAPLHLPRRSRLVVIVALTALLIALTTAVASAILTSDPGPFTACLGVKTNKGLVYNAAEGPAPYAPCSRGDLQIEFSNASGPQGEPGLTGPAGPQGPRGDPGDLSAVTSAIDALEARIDALEDAVADADGDGYAIAGGDCNDSDSFVHPGTLEMAANGVDDNCDGFIDGASAIDADGDGYDTIMLDAIDCDDSNPAIHPGAVEVVNGMDDDCDGFIDGASALDADGDGYLNATVTSDDAIDIGGPIDCDDSNPAINPGAVEMVNGVDDDCDGEVDEVA